MYRALDPWLFWTLMGAFVVLGLGFWLAHTTYKKGIREIDEEHARRLKKLKARRAKERSS